MKILISAIRFEPGKTLGSEVYLASFLESLPKVIQGEEIAIAASEECCRWGEKIAGTITWVPQILPDSTVKRMIFERNNVEKIARRWNAKVIYFPFNIMPEVKLPVVLLLHDLVNEFYCKKFRSFRPVYYNYVRYLVRNSIKKANSIITISDAIAKELLELKMLNAKQKIFTAPLAVNRCLTKTKKPKQLGEDNVKIILQSGAQLPHKSHSTGVKAMVEISKNYPEAYKQIKLVLTGDVNKDKKLKNLIEKHKIGDKITFLGRLAQDELEWVMQNAQVACFPTLYEGFGLGIVDAQLRNIPIIASDIPVLREVSGGAAVFFETGNEIELAQKIVKVLNMKKDEKKLLIKDGIKNINKWSWEDHTSKVLKVLKDTANL